MNVAPRETYVVQHRLEQPSVRHETGIAFPVPAGELATNSSTLRFS